MDVSIQNQVQLNQILERIRNYLSKASKQGQNPSYENMNSEQLMQAFFEIYFQKQQEHQQLRNNLKGNQVGNQINELEYKIHCLQDNISSIHKQRDKLNEDIISKENELNLIDKQMKSIKISSPVNQQFQELIEGITMCKEKCDYLEEENQDFKKILIYEMKKNSELKQHYQNVRERYDQNLIKLQTLEQKGLEINQRMMKQLKIINDLRFFIKSQRNDAFQQITPRKRTFNDQFMSAQYSLEDTRIIQQFRFIEVVFINIKLIVISLKNNLAQTNNKDQSESEKSFNPEQKSSNNSNDKLLVSSTLRYKTHQNLGSSRLKQRLISNPSETNKAFSELDEVEEDLDSDHKAALITDGMYVEEEMSQRQPWYYRSALPQQLSNKTESKNWEFGSEKKRFKSKPSFASFTSNSSCLKGCTMTLKEDFQNIQQSQPSERVVEDDELKEKDTEVNNSYEIAQLVQQEQIISDSTILINRKHRSVIYANSNQKDKKSSVITFIGVTICSIGVLCWGAKKLYEKYC
ncbi:unnamed protein product (macronuclear) [Paramecium tetraurelia]|uniref:Transmembrane protein n=1 Tax=Paramecium tetraurelia TaxID=5888 RepID=A0DXM8_PARTE|nr:uncharacterized protein GSPATT00021419001 [Paramecium tetraurelia]CAK87795.1 unnamed protein product [Paramecium tetraurelia]|eukprot:XP_001455192.1 hypothetical protein (macronuclear) [Paramecium tetraurelia strain d4-2]